MLKLQKKYDIRWDGKTLVNLDDDMADRCWAAGKELLLSSGHLQHEQPRVIEFSAEEVDEALRFAPDRAAHGPGQGRGDRLSPRASRTRAPPLSSAGRSTPTPARSTFVKLNEAFAQERLIDCLLFPGYLKELDGQMIRPDSGLSSRAAVLYGQWSREAVRRAGRPGMPICGHAVMALNEIACTNEAVGPALRPTPGRWS